MCNIGELEPCEVWSEKKRKARKKHRCSCCRGEIDPGEVYTLHFSIFEGEMTSEKLCAPCEKERFNFGAAHDFGICTPSYFRELLDECIAEGDQESERIWIPVRVAMEARAAFVQKNGGV